MQPAITLDYGRPRNFRPQWATQLGAASIVLGALGVCLGAMQFGQAWDLLRYPDGEFEVPPSQWVLTLYVAARVIALGVSLPLITAGIATLVKASTGLRLHVLYACCKLPLVALTAAIQASLFQSDKGLAIVPATAEGLLFAAYPTFILLFVLRREARLRRLSEAHHIV